VSNFPSLFGISLSTCEILYLEICSFMMSIMHNYNDKKYLIRFHWRKLLKKNCI